MTKYGMGEILNWAMCQENACVCCEQDRFGEPKDAWKREVLNVPEIGPKDVLVYVMATGINYNNVWAARGIPIDVIADRQKKGEP